MQQHAPARGIVKRALMVELKLLRITFIGVGSSKNYLRQPRLNTVVSKQWDATGWNKLGKGYRGNG